MFKIALAILSFFEIVFNNTFVNEKEINDFIIVYEEDNNEPILYQNGDVLLSGTKNNYRLTIGNDSFLYQVDDVKITILNDVNYLFYVKEGSLLYDVYTKVGALSSKENVVTTNPLTSYGVENDGEEIYIYYNVAYGERTFLYLHKVLDGLTKELSNGKNGEVVDYKLADNYLYLLVKKEAITEDVFGNGGLDKGIVIAKLDCDFKVVKYITMDEEEDDKSIALDVRESMIYLVKEKSIHLFNHNLESLNYKVIGNNLLIIVGYLGQIYVFLEDKIEVLSDFGLMKIGKISYPFDVISASISSNKVSLLTSDVKYNVDVVDCRSLHSYKYLTDANSGYYTERLNSLKSIFGLVDLKKKDYDEYYLSGAYGLYNVNLHYETKGLINFNIELEENVPLECNLRDNMIYPNGYRIKFNGEGLIDGNAVLSNYQIKNSGAHEVVITGINTQKKYNIYVDYNQSSLGQETSYVIDDYQELIKNEKFSMTFNLDRNLDIKRISSEGIAIDSFMVEDNILTIIFTPIRTSGYYFLYLDYFEYEETVNGNKIINRYYLNKEYWYHISKDDVIVSNDCYLDDMSFELDLIDNDEVTRYIEFELVNASRNYLQNIPFGTAPIVFTGVPTGDYELRAFIVYDTGNSTLQKQKLFSYAVRISKEDSEYGTLKVSKDNSRYIKVKIEIDEEFLKDNVDEISYDREVLYSHKEVSTTTIALYSIVGFISALFVGFSMRYIFFKIKKRNNVI